MRLGKTIVAISSALAVAGTLNAQDCPHGGYLKIDPPPDANKEAPAVDLSCWLATASNMLAGAGYGACPADDAQMRADQIYEELRGHYSGSV